jgi:hypothetical protein
MGVLLINTANSKELKLVRELLDRMKIKNMEISRDDNEDFLFGEIIKKEKTGELVTRNTIMKKLKAK